MTITVTPILIGIIGPAYTYFHDGILYTLTGVAIPFVEPNSDLETGLNLILQSFTAYVAFFGSIVININTNLQGDRVNVSADVTALTLKQFSGALERNLYKKDKMRRKLHKIIQQIQIVDE